MKKSRIVNSIFVVTLLISCCVFSCKEYNYTIDPNKLIGEPTLCDDKKMTIINLEVKAMALYTDPDNFKRPFVLNQCTIRDNDINNKPKSGQNIKNFQSIAHLDECVIWSISVDLDPVNIGYIPRIEQIQIKNSNPNNTNIFNPSIIPGNSNGQARDKVKNDQALVGKVYHYNIWFSIEPPGGGNKIYFQIDPKIEANN